MPRHALKLECSEAEKAALIAITKSRREEVRIVERARIVLACLEDRGNQEVARDFGVSVPTVSKWRKRFARHGLKGLKDDHRSGKPISHRVEFRNRLFAQIEQPPPRGMSHWDGPALAEKLGASVHAIWRVLRKEGIYALSRTAPRKSGPFGAAQCECLALRDGSSGFAVLVALRAIIL